MCMFVCSEGLCALGPSTFRSCFSLGAVRYTLVRASDAVLLFRALCIHFITQSNGLVLSLMPTPTHPERNR